MFSSSTYFGVNRNNVFLNALNSDFAIFNDINTNLLPGDSDINQCMENLSLTYVKNSSSAAIQKSPWFDVNCNKGKSVLLMLNVCILQRNLLKINWTLLLWKVKPNFNFIAKKNVNCLKWASRLLANLEIHKQI